MEKTLAMIMVGTLVIGCITLFSVMAIGVENIKLPSLKGIVIVVEK